MSTIKVWLPVLTITFAAFIFNSSEFIPIGILSLIATDFGMSESIVGVSIVTFYAWIVALASLPLMLLFSQVELKKLMLYVLVLFVVANIISSLAHTLALLVVSRLLVATAHSIFWSIVSVMAVRAAPEGKHNVALSFILGGTSIAMIMGLPLGRTIGLYFGWRMTFLCIGVFAFIILILFWRFFPTMPSNSNVSIRSLPSLIGNKIFQHICVITALLITAHFTAYSYIEPFLAEAFSENGITWILVLFGLMGFLAGVLFSKFFALKPKVLVSLSIFGISLCLLLLYPFLLIDSTSLIILCALWGLCITLFGVIFQALTIKSTPDGATVAMSIYSAIFNVGIGSGALMGGYIYADFGVVYVGFAGGILAICASLYYMRVVNNSLL